MSEMAIKYPRAVMFPFDEKCSTLSMEGLHNDRSPVVKEDCKPTSLAWVSVMVLRSGDFLVSAEGVATKSGKNGKFIYPVYGDSVALRKARRKRLALNRMFKLKPKNASKKILTFVSAHNTIEYSKELQVAFNWAFLTGSKFYCDPVKAMSLRVVANFFGYNLVRRRLTDSYKLKWGRKGSSKVRFIYSMNLMKAPSFSTVRTRSLQRHFLIAGFEIR